MSDVDLNQARSEFVSALAAVDSDESLLELSHRYLGRKGLVTTISAGMAGLAPEQRKTLGREINAFKQRVEQGLDARKAELRDVERQRDLARHVDLEAVIGVPRRGALHPVTRTRMELEGIFRDMGFAVLDGPHVEDERLNFDGLNFEPGHPARDMADTFIVQSDAAALCLRTHTSPVQVRAMLHSQPPIRAIMPGTVFRRDDDATHSPMFHQIEGLYIDVGVTMADLKATLGAMIGALFGNGLATRLRPSYFPFVEPGAEFDMQCPFCRTADGDSPGCNLCKGTGFIELGGCGMVHPQVLVSAGHDPERYTGWAFGFGIDRIAMLRHSIPHLSHFFEGDVRFAELFPC